MRSNFRSTFFAHVGVGWIRGVTGSRGDTAVVTDPLVGHWRLEVKPAHAATSDMFIHVLEVGASATLATMHTCTLEQSPAGYSIHIDLGNNRFADVAIDRSDPVLGHIAIHDGATVLVDEPLSAKVQPQNTLTGK